MRRGNFVDSVHLSSFSHLVCILWLVWLIRWSGWLVCWSVRWLVEKSLTKVREQTLLLLNYSTFPVVVMGANIFWHSTVSHITAFSEFFDFVLNFFLAPPPFLFLCFIFSHVNWTMRVRRWIQSGPCNNVSYRAKFQSLRVYSALLCLKMACESNG